MNRLTIHKKNSSPFFRHMMSLSNILHGMPRKKKRPNQYPGKDNENHHSIT